MKNILRKKSGFTLVELMVVVIIVGILATVSVPIYRGQVVRSRATEGEALLGSVATAQRVYYVEHGEYTDDEGILGIAAAGNRFFTSFSIDTANESGFTAETNSNTTPAIKVEMEFDNTAGARTKVSSGTTIYKNEID